jgi:phosphoglycerate dehydrogenase-like enzyme
MIVYTNIEFNDSQRQHMREEADEDVIYFADPENPSSQDKDAFLEAEIAFGSCAPEWLPLTRDLRWMQFDSVGVGEYSHLNWDELGTRLTCTNLRGFFAMAVAETVLGGILTLYRGLDRLSKLRADRSWKKLELRSQLRSLSEAKVIILGYGATGKKVHSLLGPFGCTVIPVAKSKQAPDVEEVSKLDHFLPLADIVVAALPDTPKTRGLFGEQRFVLLKKGAVFVNVGRGSLVDEAALINALSSGHLGGAVIDVTREEPISHNHPLWDAPNAVLTQHTAGGTFDELERKFQFFEQNLGRYRRGDALENVVNWKRGY